MHAFRVFIRCSIKTIFIKESHYFFLLSVLLKCSVYLCCEHKLGTTYTMNVLGISKYSTSTRPNVQYNKTWNIDENVSNFYNGVLKNDDDWHNSTNGTTTPISMEDYNDILNKADKEEKEIEKELEDLENPLHFHDPPNNILDNNLNDGISIQSSEFGTQFQTPVISLVSIAIFIAVVKVMFRYRTNFRRKRQTERAQESSDTAPAPPQPNEPYGPRARLVDSDFCANPEADLPPNYVECATTDDEIIDIRVDQPKTPTTDELPSADTACPGLLPNTDNSSKNTQTSQY